jgi:hypothetical protein
MGCSGWCVWDSLLPVDEVLRQTYEVMVRD